MDIAQVARQLREAEYIAHEKLKQGYREDMESLQRLVAGPLGKARRDLREHFLSIGPLDPILRRNLFAQEAEEVVSHCLQGAFANADVRFRARFGMYATALADAQNRYLRRAPRRITLPHLLHLDERAVMPQCEVAFATIDEWTDELRTIVCAALGKAAHRACLTTAKRGLRSLARSLRDLHLEAQKRPPGSM